MSIKAMTWARDQVVGGGPRKLVLMLLADYADDDGRCWPGIDTIAEKAEVHEKTVRRHLQNLEEAGFLERTRQRRQDGTMGVYTYQLRIPRTWGPISDVAASSSAQDTPAGKMSGGDRGSSESTVNTGESPGVARPPDTPTSAQDAPVGRMSGGRNGANQGRSSRKGPGHRTLSPSPPDSESRTTGHRVRAEPSVNYEQPEGPPSSPPPARNELENFLGENHRGALEALRALPGWGPMVERSFVQRYVTGPTGELLMKGVPEEHQPAVVAECVWQYLEPNEDETPARWSGSRFSGWLRSCGRQARRNVAVAVSAEAVGEPSPDGSQPLEGGGLRLPDGRCLTPSQAAAYQRTRDRMASMGAG